MDILVRPSRNIYGEIKVPSSKSYTHRYYFISLWTNGETKIDDPLISDDTMASFEAITKFGARGKPTYIVSDGSPKPPNGTIDCRRSGTTSRFSTAVAAYVNGVTIVDGDRQLRRRPIRDLALAIEQIGAKILSQKDQLPLVIKGGQIKNQEISINASKSSQFLSALLLLGAKIGLTIHVPKTPVSKGYINITLKCLEDAGVKVYHDEYKLFTVEASEIKGGFYTVPGDYSSASFMILVGILGGRISLIGLDPNDIQPDKRIHDIARCVGAQVRWKGNKLIVSSDKLESFEIDLRDSPDLLPVTSIIAAFARGRTLIKGIKHNRLKESDRVNSVAINLKRMGINVEVYDDEMTIYGGRPQANTFYSFGDHRIAMAFTVAALFLEGPSKILGVEVIGDSYPHFLEHIKRLGGLIEVC